MKYEFIRSKRKTLSLQIKDGKVIVRAPMKTSLRQIESFISEHEAWIAKKLAESTKSEEKASAAGYLTDDDIKALSLEAKRVIPERVEHFAKVIGVSYGRITIRCQKTKWGSCSAKGNLNFNCLLMIAPPEVLDSVIVHELCHRKEMNHSQRFYGHVYRAFPEYDKWHGWLSENGQILMKRAK